MNTAIIENGIEAAEKILMGKATEIDTDITVMIARIQRARLTIEMSLIDKNMEETDLIKEIKNTLEQAYSKIKK